MDTTGFQFGNEGFFVYQVPVFMDSREGDIPKNELHQEATNGKNNRNHERQPRIEPQPGRFPCVHPGLPEKTFMIQGENEKLSYHYGSSE